MPNLPNWKPPIAVRPITAEAFVGLATYIDLGCKAVALNDERVAEGCESGCMPNTSPRLGDMAATLYTYIPTSSLPWDEVVLAPGMAAPEDDGDRASHYTFRFGRAKLLGVLAGLTPESVKKELGDVSPGLSGCDFYCINDWNQYDPNGLCPWCDTGATPLAPPLESL